MLRLFVLLTVFGLCAAPVRAQSPAPSARAASQSDLSPDQQARYKARMTRARGEYAAIQANANLSAAQKQARSVALAKQVDADTLAILTPTQRAFILQRRAAGAAFQKAHAAQIAQFRALQRKFTASLSPAQRGKMDAVFQDNNAQIAQIVNNPAASEADKAKRAAAIRRSADAKIKALLTPTQAAEEQQLQQMGTALQAQAQAVVAH